MNSKPAKPAFTSVRNDKGTFDKYAWPGGYPIYYIAADMGTLCADCANNEKPVQAAELPENLDCPDYDQWLVIQGEVNWEDPDLYCDNCNGRIESAYAEGAND